MEEIYNTQGIRYSPMGEYLRLLVLRKLSNGSARVEEIDQMVKEAVEQLGMRYSWNVWPKLLNGEVEIKDGIATITPRGRWILEQTNKEITEYVKKWLGVSL